MNKKVLMIIASDKFRDEEYQEPREILERAGAHITVASSSLKEATGMLGLKVTADQLLSDIQPEDYDAVLFVGGLGATEYWDDPVAHKIAQVSVSTGKITSAICLAPMTLVNAGLLKGKRATIWKDVAEEFSAKEVIYTGSAIEKDGLIITGSGPEAASDFGDAIVEALK